MESSTEGILRGGKFKKLIESRLSDIKDKTGLKRVDIEVLYFLSKEKEHNTMTDICQHLQMNKGHISSVMDSLCKKGYIVQTPDKNDRRYMHFSLTDKGKEVAVEIEKIWKDIKNELYYGLTDEEIASFRTTFHKICKNIEHFMV